MLQVKKYRACRDSVAKSGDDAPLLLQCASLSPGKVIGKNGLYQLRRGASSIDIVPFEGELGRQGGRAPAEEGRNMHHFCLCIDLFDEIEIKRFLEEKGVRYSDLETHYGAEGYGPSLYIKDPENNIVELKGPATINL